MKLLRDIISWQLVDSCNMFVKYLPQTIKTDEDLQHLFEGLGVYPGHIARCKLMIHRQTGSSLGYGFIRFTRPTYAADAATGLHGFPIEGKFLLCKLANALLPGTNLYIKPLPDSMTEDDLKNLFGDYGAIARHKILLEKHTGRSRRIGFVEFANLDEAVYAKHCLDGFQLHKGEEPLVVKYAENGEQKLSRKSRQDAQKECLLCASLQLNNSPGALRGLRDSLGSSQGSKPAPGSAQGSPGSSQGSPVPSQGSPGSSEGLAQYFSSLQVSSDSIGSPQGANPPLSSSQVLTHSVGCPRGLSHSLGSSQGSTNSRDSVIRWEYVATLTGQYYAVTYLIPRDELPRYNKKGYGLGRRPLMGDLNEDEPLVIDYPPSTDCFPWIDQPYQPCLINQTYQPTPMNQAYQPVPIHQMYQPIYNQPMVNQTIALNHSTGTYHPTTFRMPLTVYEPATFLKQTATISQPPAVFYQPPAFNQPTVIDRSTAVYQPHAVAQPTVVNHIDQPRVVDQPRVIEAPTVNGEDVGVDEAAVDATEQEESNDVEREFNNDGNDDNIDSNNSDNNNTTTANATAVTTLVDAPAPTAADANSNDSNDDDSYNDNNDDDTYNNHNDVSNDSSNYNTTTTTNADEREKLRDNADSLALAPSA